MKGFTGSPARWRWRHRDFATASSLLTPCLTCEDGDTGDAGEATKGCGCCEGRDLGFLRRLGILNLLMALGLGN